MYRQSFRKMGLVIAASGLAFLQLVPARAMPFATEENNKGSVMVAVTPLTLSKTADTWDFNIQLNTHVAPITQDLARVSTLSDGKGRTEAALAWRGDPPGGHHRKGILVFKAMQPAPASVTLTIRQVGSIPERAFTWSLANP